MATGSKLWRRISIHEVVLTWVRAEIGRFRTSTLKDLDGRLIDKLVFAPDLQSSIENRLRLRMLYMTRLAIISEIPPDTLWHVVRNFRHDDVMGLFVLNSLEWVGADGDNRIEDAAKRRGAPLAAEPADWDMPILFGTARSEPFSIIEGNHRLTAYCQSGRTDIDIPCIVGVSALGCYWHAPDKSIRGPLMRDILMRPTLRGEVDRQ